MQLRARQGAGVKPGTVKWNRELKSTHYFSMDWHGTVPGPGSLREPFRSLCELWALSKDAALVTVYQIDGCPILQQTIIPFGLWVLWCPWDCVLVCLESFLESRGGGDQAVWEGCQSNPNLHMVDNLILLNWKHYKGNISNVWPSHLLWLL